MKSKGAGLKIRKVCFWLFAWFGLTVGITLTGALIGTVLFVAGGLLLDMDLSVQEMAKNGVFDGGFYALIWAPGISFVICLMAIKNNFKKF